MGFKVIFSASYSPASLLNLAIASCGRNLTSFERAFGREVLKNAIQAKAWCQSRQDE
jgi:hypothetical protein